MNWPFFLEKYNHRYAWNFWIIIIFIFFHLNTQYDVRICVIMVLFLNDEEKNNNIDNTFYEMVICVDRCMLHA